MTICDYTKWILSAATSTATEASTKKKKALFNHKETRCIERELKKHQQSKIPPSLFSSKLFWSLSSRKQFDAKLQQSVTEERCVLETARVDNTEVDMSRATFAPPTLFLSQKPCSVLSHSMVYVCGQPCWWPAGISCPQLTAHRRHRPDSDVKAVGFHLHITNNNYRLLFDPLCFRFDCPFTFTPRFFFFFFLTPEGEVFHRLRDNEVPLPLSPPKPWKSSCDYK